MEPDTDPNWVGSFGSDLFKDMITPCMGKWQILYLRTRYRSKLGWLFRLWPIQRYDTTRDRPERDSARAPVSLSGRISCRSRSKINSKIPLLTGAQDLLPEQDLLLEQEHMLEQKLHTSHSRINMLFCHVLPKLCQKRSFCFLKDGT